MISGVISGVISDVISHTITYILHLSSSSIHYDHVRKDMEDIKVL